MVTIICMAQEPHKIILMSFNVRKLEVLSVFSINSLASAHHTVLHQHN